MPATQPVRADFPALGGTASVLVTRPAALPLARQLLADQLIELDRACSRFRPDSELTLLTGTAGRPAPVSPLLRDAVRAALWAAQATGGLVDPTVGELVARLGYDRDFPAVDPDGPPVGGLSPAPGHWRVRLDGDQLLVPRGVRLDLGATAKAFAADRAAESIAVACDGPVLVCLGGDVAMAGGAPEGGWRIGIGEDHRRVDPTGPVVALAGGGLATSSTTVRRWKRGGRVVHHIVDPRTGDLPAPVWRTVSVAAASCLAANAASTAAIVLAAEAAGWLSQRRLPARLVDQDGRVSLVDGWPVPVMAAP